MKGRESGMPEASVWAGFFDAEGVVDRCFGPEGCLGDALEIGCGYGTFTLPAARRTRGILTALDIEPALVAAVVQAAAGAGLGQVRAVLRDVLVEGTGLPDGSQAHVMLYNLLHVEGPERLLAEALRVLAPGGKLSVIHWRSDIPTPRGPSLDIRPTPAQMAAWMGEAGFRDVAPIDLGEAAPWHVALAGYSGRSR